MAKYNNIRIRHTRKGDANPTIYYSAILKKMVDKKFIDADIRKFIVAYSRAERKGEDPIEFMEEWVVFTA